MLIEHGNMEAKKTEGEKIKMRDNEYHSCYSKEDEEKIHSELESLFEKLLPKYQESSEDSEDELLFSFETTPNFSSRDFGHVYMPVEDALKMMEEIENRFPHEAKLEVYKWDTVKYEDGTEGTGYHPQSRSDTEQ